MRRRHIRNAFKGKLVLNGGYDREEANTALPAGEADAIAFGVPFRANPDLIARFEKGVELNAPDFATFCSPGDKGYTDYPTLGG